MIEDLKFDEMKLEIKQRNDDHLNWEMFLFDMGLRIMCYSEGWLTFLPFMKIWLAE